MSGTAAAADTAANTAAAANIAAQPTAAAANNAAAANIAAQPATAATTAATDPTPINPATDSAAGGAQGKPYVIYIIFYSMYHHVYKIAQKIEEGVKRVPNVEVKMFRVEETLPAEVLTLMHAAPTLDIPVIKAADLPNADGYLFGTPTRYGIMSGAMKAFWDTTGGLWMKGALKNKMAGLFFSTGSQHGGQETTALTFLTTFAHQGIIYVPLGNLEPMTRLDQIVGGSYYGSGTIAGADGSRNPSEIEYELALTHGEQFATTLSDYMTGVRNRHGVAAPSQAPASTGATNAATTQSATSAQPAAAGAQPAAAAAPTAAAPTAAVPTAAAPTAAATAPNPVAQAASAPIGKRKSLLSRVMKKLG
ncbi:flavoprotein-like protein [Syncephalis fuscata]|nr:flavoprotein-like protein [Syncephalis fuscata]